jgi:hypothetical protein
MSNISVAVDIRFVISSKHEAAEIKNNKKVRFAGYFHGVGSL